MSLFVVQRSGVVRMISNINVHWVFKILGAYRRGIFVYCFAYFLRGPKGLVLIISSSSSCHPDGLMIKVELKGPHLIYSLTEVLYACIMCVRDPTSCE